MSLHGESGETFLKSGVHMKSELNLDRGRAFPPPYTSAGCYWEARQEKYSALCLKCTYNENRFCAYSVHAKKHKMLTFEVNSEM